MATLGHPLGAFGGGGGGMQPRKQQVGVSPHIPNMRGEGTHNTNITRTLGGHLFCYQLAGRALRDQQMNCVLHQAKVMVLGLHITQ